MFVLKIPKINEKEAGDGPFKKKKNNLASERRAVWPDGYFIIKSLAIYHNYDRSNSIKMPKLAQQFANIK